MAIPISMPNSDDVEESYRSLDLLLEQLLITLRQVLMHRRREAAADLETTTPRRRRCRTESRAEATRVADAEPRLPLPDLVLDAERDCPSTRSRKPSPTADERATAPPAWVQVGAELRRIADRFGATNSQEQEGCKASRCKDASLLSLLRPPLGSSVWTTVALLIGWGLLSRTR